MLLMLNVVERMVLNFKRVLEPPLGLVVRLEPLSRVLADPLTFDGYTTVVIPGEAVAISWVIIDAAGII